MHSMLAPIDQRLITYRAERDAEQRQMADHYGMQSRPWPWEPPLAAVAEPAADRLFQLSLSIRHAVGTAPSGTLPVIEVRVRNEAERQQLLSLLEPRLHSCLSFQFEAPANAGW